MESFGSKFLLGVFHRLRFFSAFRQRSHPLRLYEPLSKVATGAIMTVITLQRSIERVDRNLPLRSIECAPSASFNIPPEK